MPLISVAHLAKSFGVSLRRTSAVWYYDETNPRARRWGSRSPSRCAQAYEIPAKNKAWGFAIAINDDCSAWPTEGLEATLHELAHLVRNTVSEETVLEQEIAWLSRLVLPEAAVVRNRLIAALAEWGIWTPAIVAWRDACLKDKRELGAATSRLDTPQRRKNGRKD